MMRKFWIVILFLVLGVLQANAHSGKARYHAIVDTDGGFDDLRAIAMLLASPEVEVLAITTSDGVLSAREAAAKVSSMLEGFFHQGIPLGVGGETGLKAPPFRSFASGINWGPELATRSAFRDATEVIEEAFEHEDEKITLLALGSLANFNQWFSRYPSRLEMVERLVWYNGEGPKGVNFNFDKKSALTVLSSGLPVEVITSLPGGESLSREWALGIKDIPNRYARLIGNAMKQAREISPKGMHFSVWDELVPLYLVNEEFFQSRPSAWKGKLEYFPREGAPVDSLYKALLRGPTYPESRVFLGFPEDPAYFAPDVRPYIETIISRHGPTEWRIGVLTNELHGHLGIYAIIGAKMGLRAREFFNIGVDDMHVLSYAGFNPPVSCMNDGLQVSTGGTLGHGLISLAEGEIIAPKASFSFKAKSVTFSLKKEYANQIREDVKRAIQQHGNLTEDYWAEIRHLALEYWANWDRHLIFDVN